MGPFTPEDTCRSMINDHTKSRGGSKGNRVWDHVVVRSRELMPWSLKSPVQLSRDQKIVAVNEAVE